MRETSHVPNEKIDQAILAAVGRQFLKVARIIAEVGDRFGTRDDEFYERVAIRIAALVVEKRLQSAGDITRWRYSEIRLPS